MSPTLLCGQDVNLTFRDLTAPLLRRWRAWMLTFVSVFAVAALIGILRPQTYESHVSFLISRAGARSAQAAEAKMGMDASIPAAADQEVKQQAESLRDREFLERVVLTNALQNEPSGRLSSLFLPRETEAMRVAHAVRQLDRQLQVHSRPGSNVIEVAYRSTDSSRAYAVLNSLANLYLAQYTLRAASASNSTSNPQSLGYEAAIEDAESGLREFEGTQDRSDASHDFTRQLTAAVDQSRIMELAISSDEQRIRSDEEQIKLNPRQSPLALLREQLERDQADLATQRASLIAVRHAIEVMKAQVTKPGGNPFKDADIEHEVKADEQSYLQYLSKREGERVPDRGPAVSAAIVAPATIPASPVHGRGIVLIIALGLATAMSFPTALILDCLDPCFHTASQVIETLGIPVVLAVPKRTG